MLNSMWWNTLPLTAIDHTQHRILLKYVYLGVVGCLGGYSKDLVSSLIRQDLPRGVSLELWSFLSAMYLSVPCICKISKSCENHCEHWFLLQQEVNSRIIPCPVIIMSCSPPALWEDSNPESPLIQRIHHVFLEQLLNYPIIKCKLTVQKKRARK